MAQLNEIHPSYWIASTLDTSYPSLAEDISVDVAIVGAGLVGVTAAKLLKQAGKTVALLEADQIASGVSGHTTAKVTSLHQLIYAQLIDSIGEEKARLYAESNQAGLELLAAFVQDEQIDCDFMHKDAYTYVRAADQLSKIEAEVTAAQKLGLPASFVQDLPLPFNVAGAVKFSNQAQFHPRKFILNLAAKIHGNGSYVFQNTRVCTVKGEEPCRVITENGSTVIAQDVIITTNLPILDQGLFFAKTYPKRSYIVAGRIRPDQNPQGMFIGADQNYRSIRTTPLDDGGTLLMMGGEGHKVGELSQTDKCYQKLEQDMQRYFSIKPEYRWSTQDYVSFDKLPYVGKLMPTSNHTYVATGFSLWGMSKSFMSAMLLSDLVLGIANPWAELYDATRPTPFVTKESLKQNLDVGTHWIGDRIKGLFDSPQKLERGEAKITTADGHRIAAYRDEASELHLVSAVCPHLGCIVDWNEAEKSWDCPCHGSRFSCDGEILHGPAVNKLKQRNPVAQ